MTLRTDALPALLSMLCLALLSACGQDARPLPVREPGVSGKPNVELGAIECAIVDRPALDRAVLEADWRLGADTLGCELRLGLPDGALVTQGENPMALPVDARAGTARWTIQFPRGGVPPLDAVVRLCGDIARGPRVIEAYARLWKVPGEPSGSAGRMPRSSAR